MTRRERKILTHATAIRAELLDAITPRRTHATVAARCVRHLDEIVFILTEGFASESE